ncbi:biopolymer transporter ExbD [Leucothrix sargassi]|nr:biopolymer transporter ExbD [Leucothrix sargassi]
MKRFDQINMIPFIDIMLVLLAIVLTTASFVTTGLIEVNLPKAGQVSEAPRDSDPVRISIDAENQLYFAEEKIEIEALASRLEGLPSTQAIVLRVDKVAVFEHFIELLDTLKSQKFTNVSIQAEPNGAAG